MTTTAGLDPHRLTRDVLPRHYRLVLEPDIAAASFTGTASIEIELTDRVDRIVLNAIELDVTSAFFSRPTSAGGPKSPGRDLSIELDATTERLILTPDAPLEPGPAVLDLTFAGTLNDKLKGFYRSTFTDDDGAEHTIATTQFQSTDARRAFPCWDEPAFKATFGISLVVDPAHLAVSNTSEMGRDTRADGRVAVHFADTIPMSTYLVAFVVGPLEATEPVDVDGVPLRVVHRPGQGHLTGFAIDVAAKALGYFTEYYGLAYPGDKVDLIAIPDFAFGAMENLGCVTFREVLLLADPAATTQPELQRVADVINHELAHMWFGDLVTMRWWNGIWLNEAFATFMETKATDNFAPEWQRWVDFGLSRSMAFDVDALEATRPIEYHVESPADAEGMFDVLTYEKGASVVRMLEQYLGEAPFRDGIAHYLQLHQLDNTETHDLWDALEATTGEPVRDLMEGWIFQGGFPVVSYEQDGDRLTLRQQQFRYDDSAPTSGHWLIPIRARVGDRIEKGLLDDTLTLPASDAILPSLNADSAGFYRVRHPAETLTTLQPADLGALPVLERYTLIDDAWALTLAGSLPVGGLLALTHAFRTETDESVWQRITGALATLHHLWPSATRPDFEAEVRTLLQPTLDRVGWQAGAEESDRDRQLRATLLTAAGITANHATIQDQARTVLADGTDDPAVNNAAVHIVASVGTAEEFADYWSHYQDAGTPQEERRYLAALARFPGRTELLEFTRRCLTDDIRSQDGPYSLAQSLGSRDHGAEVWAFVTEHWTEINERFPSNSIARMLSGIRSLTTPDLAESVGRFLTDHPVPQGAKIVAQHRERQLINVALAARLAEEQPLPRNDTTN
ncbi:MAG: M1 family metallopeptidase [Acidimicrobiales bacterium]|nr:M1 family metallopeptidase [Acidimicrobiales bacterium]